MLIINKLKYNIGQCPFSVCIAEAGNIFYKLVIAAPTRPRPALAVRYVCWGLLIGLFTGCAPQTTIYLVRHADRADESDTTSLSAAGYNRAKRLAARLANERLDSIYVTAYTRSGQTADPVAQHKSLQLVVYPVTPEQIITTYPGRILTVGSGRGAAKGGTAFYLLDDGRLFTRKAGETAYKFIGTQTVANTKKVFWSVEDRCLIRKTTYNKPGSTYRYIGWKKGAEAHTVTWAPGSKDVPGSCEQVYNGFVGMLPVALRPG